MSYPQALFTQIFFILLLMGFVKQGFSIKCWDCRSDSDPKCGDPFDNTTVPIIDCSHEKELEHLPGVKATMCRKTRQKVNGKWTYIRGCAFLGEPGIGGDERYCLMRTGTFNIFMEYCTCNTKDGCNAASFLNSNFAVIIEIIFALILLSPTIPHMIL